MKKLTLFIALFVLINGTLTACGEDTVPDNSGGSSVTETQQGNITTVISVDGMTCGSCEARIHSKISALSGVVSVTVSHSSKSATVEHDSTVTVDAIREAIMDAGYTPLD